MYLTTLQSGQGGFEKATLNLLTKPDHSRPHEMDGSVKSALESYKSPSMLRTFAPLLWHNMNNLDNNDSFAGDEEK